MLSITTIIYIIIQIIITMRYHFSPIRTAIIFKKTSVGEVVEVLEHWCAVGGNVKLVQCYREQYDIFSKT